MTSHPLPPPPQADKGKARALEPVLFQAAGGPSRAVAGPSQPARGRASVPAQAPRYATQMPALFTQQNAVEEAIQDKNVRESMNTFRLPSGQRTML